MGRLTDILVLDYGQRPRGPIEESLAGDWSKTLGLANVLRDKILEQGVWKITEPEVVEWGAVMWFQPEGGPSLRSIVVEPVVDCHFTWAVRFEEMTGVAGAYLPRRLDVTVFEVLKQVVSDAVAAASSDFRNTRWITSKEYRQMRSASGA
jgi:hypothetical protein